MLGEDGQKMSKSKRNYREPNEIFDRYGADALRWYFFANQPPWTTIRYSEQAIKDSIPEFLLRLWNVYSFFVIYANIDGFDPAAESAGESRASFAATSLAARQDLSADQRAQRARSLDPQRAESHGGGGRRADGRLRQLTPRAQQITEFVDALSNWYVRRSRDRFWSEDKRDPDKLDAYWTLYECLLTTAKLIAPFVPFLAEAMWQNLAAAARSGGSKCCESVHLCDFPTGDAAAIDEQLSTQMNLVREIVSLGLAARMGAKLKVRQPLAKVEVILADRSQQAWLEEHVELLRKELNVKQVEFTQKADQYITYTVLPDLKRLGPRLGKQLPLVKNGAGEGRRREVAGRDGSGREGHAQIGRRQQASRSIATICRFACKPSPAGRRPGKDCVVVLATEITPELVTEGVAREIVHADSNRPQGL